MATLSTQINVTAPTTSRLSAMLYTLKERLTRYALYRRTMSELSDLRDADLADIGLNRSMIKRAALEAAYDQEK